jgi:hypothetical protein
MDGMTKLNPVEVAIHQAESILPLTGTAFEAAVIQRPETATDAEHLGTLITVTEGALLTLGAFLKQWKTIVSELERKSQ